jgi:hypothetical protein
MTGLEHLYLEDSYFLGLTVSGKDLRLRALFALTFDHPHYEAPRPGEQHCYREGDICVEGLQIVTFSKGSPVLVADPDGTLDLGSIEFTQQGEVYRVTTDWFDLQFRADTVSVMLN